MSVITLTSGSNVALNELLPGGSGPIVIGFGWRLIAANGLQTELVPSAMLCGQDGSVLSDEHMVFFNQLSSPDGSVVYVEGDEEQLELDLHAVPDEVSRISFVVYADPDLRKVGNFGPVRDAYMRVLDKNGKEVVRYSLDGGTSSIDVTAMIFGEIYRHNGIWKMRAVGQGYKTGIEGVAKDFGVAI
jgi:tellurium resistance protein TerD